VSSDKYTSSTRFSPGICVRSSGGRVERVAAGRKQHANTQTEPPRGLDASICVANLLGGNAVYALREVQQRGSGAKQQQVNEVGRNADKKRVSQ
jgi:hypothetical protein